ncbi:hypothetical protein [Nocardia asteroides]|uniref:hypothetical protein n=1 Tax=Nocardia asteroides TaxID=1824 RepID=UPI001E28A6D0|nr:hypothetical protein [Nocardia asteroides]UGT59297.1 hypothetical protein LTT61_18645 [Nocardia asteroides]
MRHNFSRRLLVAVDATGYGAGDDQRQRSIQAAIPRVLDRSALRAGLNRSRWSRQPTGDGELAVLPEDESDNEPLVVDNFVRELDFALADHNHDLKDEARLRLRLAVHIGVANPADSGFAGQGVVAVSRMVDSDALKAALRGTPAANLAAMVSGPVYTDVIAQRHTSIPPAEFREVQVVNKEFSSPGYIYIPGVRLWPEAAEQQESSNRGRPGRPGERTDHQYNSIVKGDVYAQGGVVGFQWNQ